MGFLFIYMGEAKRIACTCTLFWMWWTFTSPHIMGVKFEWIYSYGLYLAYDKMLILD
jgi:hypothetical protein